ncbi:MAG: choice-of-anchor D domain-containing protein [Terracidiphilus sp.]
MTQTTFCADSFWRWPVAAGAAWLAIAAAAAGAQTNFGAINVGSSATAMVTVTLPAPATLGSIAVLTQGAAGLDFTNGGGGSCAAGTTYEAEQSCTVQVKFTPVYPGERYGAALLLDGSGNVIASALLEGNGLGPQIAFGPGTAIAFAPMANGVAFNDPFDATVDGKGNLYITDQNNSRVVELPAGGGAPIAIDPIVGGEGLVHPGGVAVDGTGNLYISDLDRNIVVEVPANGGAATVINPMVNGIGLHYPCGMVIDGAGDLYIADVDNGRVVEVPAGGGAAVAIDPLVDGEKLSYPVTLAMDSAGILYIADLFANRVVEVAANGGAATAIDPRVNGQSLHFPYGVAVDAAGDLFIADANNRVVEAPAGGGAATAITPIVNGAALNDPIGIGLDAVGDLFIADSLNNRVLEVERGQPPAINFEATAAGTVSSDSPQTVEVENVGNAALTFPVPGTGANPAISSNFTLNASAASACPLLTAGAAQPGTLAAGAACVLPISFQPAATGTEYGTLTLTDNNLNAAGPAYATQTIALSGAVPVATVSATMLAFGPQQAQTVSAPQQVTLTNTGSATLTITDITVTGANSSAFIFPNPCGASLAAGAPCTIQGNFTPAAAGPMAATLTITDNASGSPQVIFLNGVGVYPVTVAVTPSATNVTTAQAFTLTVAVGGANGEPTPTGSVEVTSGTYALGTATLTGGSATIGVPPGGLATGTDNIEAVYTPDNASALLYAAGSGETSVTVTASSTSTAPATATAVATAVTAGTATLEGTVNPNGADTHAWFLWATSSSLSGAAQTAAQDLGATAGSDAVSAPIQGLSASTTYYYQAVAQNSLGTTSGGIFSFTTTPAPYFSVLTGAPLSVAPGATTGNTSTISVTPWYGFTGVVNLSCAITPAAASDPPTCSVPATVTISGTTAQTATLIVNTTAATAMNRPMRMPWRGSGGAVLACIALLFVPLRRRSWLAQMAWVALFAAMAGMGCGGGSSTVGGGGGGGGGGTNSGTTAGTYTVTITGVSGGMTETGTVALTVQ